MPKAWLLSKKNEMITEIFRNFCFVHRNIMEECLSTSQENPVCFRCLDNLLGQETNQGRLWRLKDTAHLVFRSFPDTPLSGRSLDWALGYLFHECMKLKEDAYQLTNYVPWFESIDPSDRLSSEEAQIGNDLKAIAAQTAHSIHREIQRIKSVLHLCRRLFIAYLPQHRDNPLLARFIYAHLNHVTEVFGPQSQILIRAVYGPNLTALVRLAATSFQQGGWAEEAQQALNDLTHNTEKDAATSLYFSLGPG